MDQLGGCLVIGVKRMATEKITIEITSEELAKLRTYLLQQAALAKAGMAILGLPERILAQVVLVSGQE